MQDAQVMRDLIGRLRGKTRDNERLIVAIAGPPASGKSTFSEHLRQALIAHGCLSQVVPMDGFHLDNRVLDKKGLRHRKGAPETFDVGGFHRLVDGLRDRGQIYYPLFDREADLAVAGAGVVAANTQIVLVEGNYLLLDEGDWRLFSPKWDYKIFLEEPVEILRSRLIQRWLDNGFSEAEALQKAEKNDLLNVERVFSSNTGWDEKC